MRQLKLVSVLVKDYDAAIQFYTEARFRGRRR